jgi:hypothetical protein
MVGKIQSKAQVAAHQKQLIVKFFYSFSHIELRDLSASGGIDFSHQSRMSVLL